MAAAEDAATILDQFCHDVANVPAELTHLLEEIQYKDQQIQECRDTITTKDRNIQNFVRQNGGHVKNPKEDALARAVLTNFDRMETLQAEKLRLSEKAMVVLDRQVKRFDQKLRILELDGQFPHDPTLPSLLVPSGANSAAVSGTGTPLQALSINTAQAGGAPTIANAAMRMSGANASRTNSPVVAQNPLLNQPHLTGSATRPQREPSADASKRRRLNASISIPPPPSSLRQTSIGPSGGTPKAGTPNPTSSRAGSAQPSRPATKKAPLNKKIAPHHAAAAASSNKKRIRTSGASSKNRDRRRLLNSPTPSSSRGSVSPTPSSLPQGADGTVEARTHRHRRSGGGSDDEPEEAVAEQAEADAEGDEIYCVCQQVSYGDMVACDNENCPYQWFHWSCVGLKAEPKGDWLCPHCRDLPRDKIVKAT